MKYTIKVDLDDLKNKKFKHDVRFVKYKNHKLKVIITDFSVDIPELGFTSVSDSKSKKSNYILSYHDEYFINVDGTSKIVPGKVVFINNDELILIDYIQRPTDGKVAENGNFIINDWLSPEDLSGIFYAYDSKLNPIIKMRFSCNLGANTISEDGHYAVLETLGDQILFFNLSTGDLLWDRKRDLGNIKLFKFDTEKEILTITYLDHNRSYQYSFQGELLDKELFEKEHIKYASGYLLYDIAKKKTQELKDNETHLSDYNEILSYLERASKANISGYTTAKVHRLIGEIYFEHDKKEEALENFEIALSYDPKVGVKRKYDKLKNETK